AIGASRDHVRADNLKGHIPSGSSSTSLCSCGRKHFLEAASSTYPILPIHSPNAARSKVGEAIPLDDNSVDAVISTLVLCSVPDVKQTLQEIKRVLKLGGIFLFIEHVAAEDGTFFRHVQNVLDPLQQVVADGCHLTRNIGLYIAGAGFSGGAEINTAAMYSFPWIIRPHVYGVAYK
uniref:Methyltransferase type 11 domain-containing protein n=1 Tax=Brassica oleracea var. oleracea TaxID=109376 RepID=A0A0D3CXN6_BRAOL